MANDLREFPETIYLKTSGEGEDAYWEHETDPNALLESGEEVVFAEYQIVRKYTGALVPKIDAQ